VRESRERVRAAVHQSGFVFPGGRVTVNLAPADVRKAGPAFDLAIAVAVLIETGQVPGDGIAGHAVCGELSLSGALRPVRGLLSMAIGARDAGLRRLVVAAKGAGEAAVIEQIDVLPVPDLSHLAAMMRVEWHPDPAVPCEARAARRSSRPVRRPRPERCQARARDRGGGGHNLLMVGPPGSARRCSPGGCPASLPPPTFDEAIEITQIRSVAGLGGDFVSERPFRAPHHALSASGLVGGARIRSPARSRSLTAACCSWTSWPSSRATPSKPCGSR